MTNLLDTRARGQPGRETWGGTGRSWAWSSRSGQYSTTSWVDGIHRVPESTACASLALHDEVQAGRIHSEGKRRE